MEFAPDVRVLLVWLTLFVPTPIEVQKYQVDQWFSPPGQVSVVVPIVVAPCNVETPSVPKFTDVALAEQSPASASAGVAAHRVSIKANKQIANQ